MEVKRWIPVSVQDCVLGPIEWGPDEAGKGSRWNARWRFNLNTCQACSVLEWMAAISRQVPVTESPKSGYAMDVSVIIPPLVDSRFVKVVETE
jgi:hypothetical protein